MAKRERLLVGSLGHPFLGELKGGSVTPVLVKRIGCGSSGHAAVHEGRQ